MGEHRELDTSKDTNECYKTEAIELNEKPFRPTRPGNNKKCSNLKANCFSLRNAPLARFMLALSFLHYLYWWCPLQNVTRNNVCFSHFGILVLFLVQVPSGKCGTRTGSGPFSEQGRGTPGRGIEPPMKASLRAPLMC